MDRNMEVQKTRPMSAEDGEDGVELGESAGEDFDQNPLAGHQEVDKLGDRVVENERNEKEGDIWIM